ncbi:hypothetical protein, partial [Streptococcus suis]
NEGREAFLFCTNNYYAGKKTDYQTNKQKKTNISRDVCLHSETGSLQDPVLGRLGTACPAVRHGLL